MITKNNFAFCTLISAFTKRLVSCLLVLAMLMTFMPAFTLTASAAEAAKQYTITFDATNGTGDIHSETVAEGDSFTLTNDVFTYGKCEIESWNTEPDGFGMSYGIGEAIDNISEDITLYAQWVLPLHKYESFTDGDYEWSGNASSPYSFTMKNGAVLYASVAFPSNSNDDKITITVDGDCEIKGSVFFGEYDTYFRTDLTITGDGTLKFYELVGTGTGDTFTVLTDVTIVSNYMFIGASGGEYSKIVIKDATLNLHDLTLLQYLTMEGEAKLNIIGGTASFHSAPVITLSDNSVIYIGGNGYDCVLYKEGEGNTEAFDALITDGWLPQGYSFGKENYGYYLYNEADELATDAVTIKTQEYTVTFVDWDETPLKTEDVRNGMAATAPADPTREGYTFTGWDKAFDNVTSDITVTAQYEPKSYTLSFDTNGGEAIASVLVTYGEAYGNLPSSALAGFSGGDNWYLVDEYGNVTEEKITKLSKVSAARNHTLKAVRKVLEPAFKITLTAPGCISNDYQYYNPENSTRILTVTVNNMNAEMLDYTYQWYKDGTLMDGENSEVLTLHGNVWDSGTYTAEVTATLKQGAAVSAAEESASAQKEQTVAIRRLSNTLSYDANGGENAPGSHYSGSETITVSANIPEREGYRFDGWNTSAEGSGANYPGGSTYTFSEDGGNGGCRVTLYASWTEKVTASVTEATQTYTYDNTNKAFVINGTELNGFTVKYQQNGREVTPNNAGSYDVVITRDEDGTHKKFQKTLPGALVIKKADAVITVNTTPIVKTYGEALVLPAATTNFGTVTADKTAASMKNAGTYTVTYTVEGTSNYNGDTKAVNVTINPLPVNITWQNADGLIYDGSTKEIKALLANKVGDDTVNLTITGTTSATEKGIYTANVTGVDNKNYTITGGSNLTKEWAISLTANEWTTELSMEGWTYGENANAPTAAAKFGTPAYTYADSIDGAYSEDVPTDAGTYYVKATVAGTSSYTEISDTKEFIISAKKLTSNNITTIQEVTFTGEEIKPVIEVKDGETVLVPDKDFDVTYQNNTNAGTAKAIITFKGNYKGNAEMEFTILPKKINPAITLTAPVRKKAPQTIIETDEYTATVDWSPEVEDKFDYRTAYTATITITPKANYTVTGIGADEYTVDGAETVTNAADSGVVTATYAQTGNKPSSGGTALTKYYTVKFETDGGSNVSNKSVVQNGKLVEPDTPDREGYTFDGWYTDEEFETAYDFDTKVTKDFTLYAKWSEEDNNGGSSGHNCPSLAFSDLDITQWYHFDTDYVIENGIFRGTTKTTFAPNANITRAMMITVLYRAEGEPEVTGNATFLDIDKDAYYAKAVIWGQQNGIIKGYSETEFAPEQDILREQIAAIMYRYAQYKGYDVSIGENTNILSYDDFDSISEYAIAAMQWAVGSGMIKGRTESTLNPQEFAKRVEIAAMLHRFIEANR